jgi:transcriptional regulator with XRE-family HTH domain
MTQEEMAALLGVSTSLLSRVLNGYKERPELVKALWIALTSRELDEARG